MKRGTGGVKRLNMYGVGGGGAGKVDTRGKEERGRVSQTWKADSGADCCLLDLK